MLRKAREESPPPSPVIQLMNTDLTDTLDPLRDSPPPSLVDFNIETTLGMDIIFFIHSIAMHVYILTGGS